MMGRSEGELIAERVRDGVCVRGCTLRGVHFATCDDYGREPVESICRGCAPSPTHPGSAICGRCFGQMRSMLRDTPDLVGRLRSLSDPMKAMLIEPVKVFSRPVEAIAPVGPDLLDAAESILANLRDWAHQVPSTGYIPWHRRTAGISTEQAFALARDYSKAVDVQLDVVTEDPATALSLAEALLVLHPEVEGQRPGWSVADAMQRWGAERRDRHVHPDAGSVDDVEEHAIPVREWYDPLLSVKDAAARHHVTGQAVRKWIAAGELTVAARVRGPRGSVMVYAKASDVDRVAAAMKARRKSAVVDID